MKKKHTKGVTLDEISEMLGFVVEHMATKEEVAELREDIIEVKGDVAEIKKDVSIVKSDLLVLHTQVNGIESDIRDMKHARLEVRVGDLEEKVFGKAR